MTREGRLGVGIVGAGRVGPVIGAALAGVGHALIGITHGSDEERVEAVLPGVPFLDAPEVVRRSELVVLAVPHDELPGLVAGLAETGDWQPGQLAMHLDPAWGTDVLAPAVARGVIPLAIHPAMTFAGTSMDLRLLAQSYAAVTAPAAVLPIAQALAAYAEAIATATTFSRSIVAQAAALLAEAGVADPGRYLSGLVHTTVDQALVDHTAV